MKTSTTAISSIGLTNTDTSQSHNSNNLTLYPFTSSHTNQTLGPNNSIPQDPRVALLSPGRSEVNTRVQGLTDIGKNITIIFVYFDLSSNSEKMNDINIAKNLLFK
jgi:hypothetical protein